MKLDKNIVLLVVTSILNAMGMMIIVFVSLKLSELGYTKSELGITMSFFAAGGFIGGYAGGYLIDLGGVIRKAQIIILMNIIMLLALVILEKNFPTMIIILFLIGFVGTALRPILILLFTESVNPEKVIDAMAYRRVAINLGAAAGTSISGVLSMWSYDAIFLFNVLIAFMSLLTISMLTMNCEQNTQNLSKGIISNTSNLKTFILLMVVTLLIVCIFAETQYVYPIYIVESLHFSVSDLSFIFLINGVIVAVFQIPITTYLKKFNISFISALGAVCITLGLAMTAYISNYTTALVFCALWSIGEVIFFPSLLAQIIKFTPFRKGKTFGLYQTAFSLGYLIAPGAGTWMYARNENMLWNFSLILGILTPILFILVEYVTKIQSEVNKKKVPI